MQKTTSHNQESYNKLSNNSKLLNVINHSVKLFCDSLGFNMNYFSSFMPYSDSQFPKYFNPNDDTKNLKITDLELILNHLDSKHQKLILDSLCQTHGFVCVESANHVESNKSIENLLLKISASNGALADNFITALEDDELTDDEKKKLTELAYHFRSMIIQFENRINQLD